MLNYDEEVLEIEEISIGSDEESQLIVFNDDINTFDHVIQALIEVCDHSPEQAEQCTLIIHYKGKCTVKTGELNDLKPRCSKLLQLGLSAELV